MENPPTTISQAQLVDTPHPGRKGPQYAAALASCIGAIAAGTMLGWTSPAMPKLRAGDYGFDVDENDEAWIGSIATLGAASICVPIGIAMERFGRKPAMLALTLPFLLGWLLIIFASNVAMLLAGRFFTGLAGGAFCVTAPAYNNEVSQQSIRGVTGTFFQLLLTVGILFTYVVGPYVGVQVFSIICACFPIAFCVVFFFMPETPYYLLTAGRVDDAKASMTRLRGPEYDADAELATIQRAIDALRGDPTPFAQRFFKRAPLLAYAICINLMIYQQFSGINAVLFNAQSIFESAGEAISPEISTIIIGAIQVVATFCSTLFIEKLGRKALVLVSGVTMTICDTLLGVYFYLNQYEPDKAEDITWLPLLALCVFIVAFSIGYGPIPWLIAGELCTPNVKAFVSSTAGTFNWLLAFIVTRTFNDMKAGLGDGGAFWFFAGVSLFGVAFVLLVVPETKGKDIDEMQAILGGNKNKGVY